MVVKKYQNTITIYNTKKTFNLLKNSFISILYFFEKMYQNTKKYQSKQNVPYHYKGTKVT